MQLVEQPTGPTARVPRIDDLAGTPLIVAFCEGDELTVLATSGTGPVRLTAPVCVAEDDAYLLLPADIGDEIIDILADGDQQLLGEALCEGLMVRGGVEDAGRSVALQALHAVSVQAACDAGLAYGADVALRGEADPLQRLNTLGHVQCTLVSALLDQQGLDAIATQATYVGIGWRPPSDARGLQHLPPTYVFSKRICRSEVGIELALFVEDDDLIALVRPAKLTAAAATD